jgi:hypothetical protein
MELNVLLRGQSNAYLLSQSSAWAAVAGEVQSLLGFDGVTNSVNLLASSYDPYGKNTINSGTAFIGDWLKPIDGIWQYGWSDTALETGLINYIDALPADEKSAPTAIVWLHNEYDSTNPSLTTAEWMSAVTDDSAQVRAAFGQTAATVPYIFVNAIPYGDNAIDSVNQAIKLGMEEFSANPLFDAVIGAQADDLNMDYGQTGVYGGPHMDSADTALVARRLAVSIAQTFATYALPGSPIADGTVDGYGPEVMAARLVGANQVLATVANDHATLSATLDTDAANGVGWSILDNGQTLDATAAQVTASDQILLTFSGAVPTDPSAALYYAYGYGRLATGDNDPGEGNAIYDTQQMPVWTPASGVGIEQPTAAGSYLIENTDTGNLASVQGETSTIAGYSSQFAVVTADSVTLLATSPNAFLADTSIGYDALVATSGDNLFWTDQTTTLMVGGSGEDRFFVAAAVPDAWDVIDNFHAGDNAVLYGYQPGVSQLSWSQNAGSAMLTMTGGGATVNLTFLGVAQQTAEAFAQAPGNWQGTPYYSLSA